MDGRRRAGGGSLVSLTLIGCASAAPNCRRPARPNRTSSCSPAATRRWPRSTGWRRAIPAQPRREVSAERLPPGCQAGPGDSYVLENSVESEISRDQPVQRVSELLPRPARAPTTRSCASPTRTTSRWPPRSATRPKRAKRSPSSTSSKNYPNSALKTQGGRVLPARRAIVCPSQSSKWAGSTCAP